MTKGKEKSPSPPKPEGGQEQTVGPLTQLLIRSRQRILAPGRFTRGAYARDAKGNPVNVLDPKAVCWCAVGTLECEAKRSVPSWEPMPGQAPPKKGSDKLYHEAHHLLEQAAAQVLKTVVSHATEEQKKTHSITALSDGSGHAKALLMYNKAIALARGR